MAENCRLHRHGDRPDEAGCHDRGRYFGIVFGERGCVCEEVFRKKAEAGVFEDHVPKDDQKLHDSRGERADGGAGDAQFREAEFAKNECVVYRYINNERYYGYYKRYIDYFYTSERRHQHVRQYEDQESVLDYTQICTAFRYYGGVGGEDAQDLVREQHAGSQDQHSADKAKLEGDAGEFADGGHALLAPLLGCDDDQGVADRDGGLLHEEKNLVYSGCAGQSRLTVAAEHDVVGHVDTVGDDVLQGHYCHGVK